MDIWNRDDFTHFGNDGLSFGVILTFSKITFRKIFDCEKNLQIFFLAQSRLF